MKIDQQFTQSRSVIYFKFWSRLTTKVVTNEKTFAKKAKVISFDIDNAELNQGLIKFHKGFQVDLKDFIPDFYKYLVSKNTNIITKMSGGLEF